MRVNVGAGCRSTPGGLHLGHVYGCLQAIPDCDKFFFVISDQLDEPDPNSSHAVAIASQVKRLLPNFAPLRVVRESRLAPALEGIFREIVLRTRYGELVDVHPRRPVLRSGDYQGSLVDLLFPISQASYLIGLGCSHACYNDDNSRFVDFARRSARRISGDRVGPVLRRRDPGRLLGWDGRKMSKQHGNVLGVEATPAAIRRFASRLVGHASEGLSFSEAPVSGLERTYFASFGSDVVVEELRGPARIDALTSTLESYISPLRRSADDRPSTSDVIESMEQDESDAIDVIRGSRDR